MRVNFIDDKRLMDPNTPGGGGGPAPSSSIQEAEDQRLAAALGTAKDDNARIAIIRQQRELEAKRAASQKNAGILGSSGVEASDAVRKKAATDSQQNAADAARNTQEINKDALLKIVLLMQQSGSGLMQAEQSIEQTKAGFSGMLQIVGIVAKKFGADEFAQGCLDLAKDLRPELVQLSPQVKKAIEDFAEKAGIDPADTQRILNYGQTQGGEAIDRGQADIDAKARAGVKAAGDVPQPTALDGPSSGIASTAISSTKFNSALGKLMTGPNPILLGSEAVTLQEQFGKFAQGGGNTNLIDSMTERASLAASIRMGVKNEGAEKQLLAALDLSGGPK